MILCVLERFVTLAPRIAPLGSLRKPCTSASDADGLDLLACKIIITWSIVRRNGKRAYKYFRVRCVNNAMRIFIQALPLRARVNS